VYCAVGRDAERRSHFSECRRAPLAFRECPRATAATTIEENLSSEILISSDPWENRVAILEDGQLAELYVEREEKVIGSIFKGKVHNVLPGMGAAFVDIGLGRNAFLYVDDINKQPLNIGDVEITQGHSGFTISEKVKRGDDVLVQIVKEPRGLKGARISTNISLPGRYLILMPTGKYSGVSRKIESAQERNRLKAVMQRIRPEGMATVVRTAAAGVSDGELIADLGVLIRMWHGILETYKRAASPSLLHRDMNLIFKAARDFITGDVDRVLIDDEEEFRKVRDFLQLLGPQNLARIERYEGGRKLFDDFHINEEIEKLMRPKINLPSGGSIVIESTEALTVIDVNSGKFTGGRNLEDTILKTNVEAAAEVARQVRLRDIGGIIVVDFIDMTSESSRSRVIKTLEDGLRRDRTRATIQSFSNLGLLEFTRKRIGKDLGAQLRGSCPTCYGLGSVMSPQSMAIETFRQIRDRAEGSADGDVVAHVAPTVAAQMDFWYEDECRTLAESISHVIKVRVDPMLHPEHTRVEMSRNGRDDGELPVRVGDERDVELLAGRLPNPTSAAAVVGSHIVEVENAANNAGGSARIRIIDVDDDDYVLAELVTAASVAGKRRRRGRGRSRADLTAAEETKQLRQLAEEAAHQAGARPPIGITTVTEEEERQDKAAMAERRSAAPIVPVASAAPPETAETAETADDREEVSADGESRSKRRRRRRGRGGRGRNGTAGTGPSDAIAGSPPPAGPERPQDASALPHERETAVPEGEGRHKRRRRRRGRGGRNVNGIGFDAEREPGRNGTLESPDGEPSEPGAPKETKPSRAIAPVPAATPAVEPPPPSLSVPQGAPIPAKPARRRRTTTARASVARVEDVPATALPAPKVKTEPEAAKPKRTRKTPAAAVARAEVPAPAKAPARRKKATVAKKPAAAGKKKTPSAASSRKKRT
jgi:ribonuclease G